MSMLAVTERDFQASVMDLARRAGWMVAHFHDSRRQVRTRDGSRTVGDRDAKGFPDLVCVRAPRLLVAELKAEGGRLKPDQEMWLAELGNVAEVCRLALDVVGDVGHQRTGIDVRVWRPSDWPEIESTLR